MHPGLTRRALAALASATLALPLIPTAVGAAAVTRFTDHAVNVGCEGPVDGGYVSVWLATSEAFDDSGALDLWLDPAVPYEDPQSATGSTDSVVLAEGGTIMVTATIALSAPDGAPVGDATVVATMEPSGDPFDLGAPPPSNHHYASEGSIQPLEGTAEITWGGHSFAVTCGGEVDDVSIHEANPTAYVWSAAGVSLDCSWQTDEAFAALSVYRDDVGTFADAVLETADLLLWTGGAAVGTFDASGADLSIPLVDASTGDPYSATASGTFDPLGDPVTSILVRQNGRTKLVEQALVPSGSLTISSGHAFPLDAEHCSARTFAQHTVSTAPSGPKAGSPPPNDAPGGAVALRIGAKLNAQTTSTAEAAEVPIATCPEGIFDDLGHTLWYTVTGTGGPVTVDTAGSDFDTVVAVYTQDGADFSEVACNDDVVRLPVGVTYQAAVTFDTTAGVTYLIQAGGYRDFRFGGAESGRLRLAIR